MLRRVKVWLTCYSLFFSFTFFLSLFSDDDDDDDFVHRAIIITDTSYGILTCYFTLFFLILFLLMYFKITLNSYFGHIKASRFNLPDEGGWKFAP